jgi:phage baseplate assembly protein W
MSATTAVGEILGRGMAFPPRVGPDGRIAWSEGETNIREAIRIVLMTAPGERIRRSTFGAGLEQFLYEPNTTTTRRSIEDRITRAIAAWEPRVSLESVDVDEDPVDPASAIATVTFRIVATQAVERVSASISLGG